MLCVAVVIVFLLYQSSAESIAVRYRCNDTAIDSDVSYTRFYPSPDGVQGRYTAELCTFNNPNRTRLTMDLTYNENSKVCDSNYRSARWVIRPGPQHSIHAVDVAGLTNCSHVCYEMDFDLIFSSCYLLKITLNGARRFYVPLDSYFVINNNVTKDYFNKTAPYAVVFYNDDYSTLKWILGIPAVDYHVTLRKISNDTGVFLHEDSDVTQNCTLKDDVRVVQCKLAPSDGCYEALLEHGGSWTFGVFHKKKFVIYDHLCVFSREPPMLRLVSNLGISNNGTR